MGEVGCLAREAVCASADRRPQLLTWKILRKAQGPTSLHIAPHLPFILVLESFPPRTTCGLPDFICVFTVAGPGVES